MVAALASLRHRDMARLRRLGDGGGRQGEAAGEQRDKDRMHRLALPSGARRTCGALPHLDKPFSRNFVPALSPAWREKTALSAGLLLVESPRACYIARSKTRSPPPARAGRRMF